MTTDGSRTGGVQAVSPVVPGDEELRALAAIVAHHRQLDDQVARRAGAVADTVERAGAWEAAAGDLVAYLAAEVLPHALAEEHTLYRAAADRAGLAGAVAAMREEHGILAGLVDRVAVADDGPRAAAAATDVADLFHTHVRSENEVLLPALVADGEVSVARLLRAMEDELEEGHGTAGAPNLDVRALVPAARHETIFAAFDGLAPGQAFVLVNDHDPRPLRYQLEAEHPGTFTWSYDEAGPTAWRVRIGRAPAPAAG